MDDSELDREEIHRSLQEFVLEEGELLTGWIVIYEYQNTDDRPSAGHVYGPEGMTTWRALGLTEWTRRFTLVPDADDDNG